MPHRVKCISQSNLAPNSLAAPAALAVVHYKLGELEQSQDLYARAYDIQVWAFTPCHVYHRDAQVTTLLRQHYAVLRCKAHDSRGCMRQVAQLGAKHPDVATTMAATAGLLKALGKLSEAETVYRTVSCLLVNFIHLGYNTNTAMPH